MLLEDRKEKGSYIGQARLSPLLVTHMELSGSTNLPLTGVVRLEIDIRMSPHTDDA